MEEWITKVNNEIENLESDNSSQPWIKQSIYRVPPTVKCLHGEEVYTPQKVSIGPYHHGNDQLKAMEAHKHRALLHFLKRSRKPLQCYTVALAHVVEDLIDAYDELDRDKWKHDGTGDFLKMMIVDGCFVLELMRTANAGPDDLMGYAENDPLFGYHGRANIVNYLKRDILMLENQLPMLVFVILYGVENNMPVIPDDFELWKITTIRILKFLSKPHRVPECDIEQVCKCSHILDLYKKSLLSEIPCPTIEENLCFNSRKEHDNIQSATYLRASGIKIVQSRSTNISFDRHILKPPVITIDMAFKSEYLNMMAFEQYHVGTSFHEICSYIFFMSCLIRDARDVGLLSDCGVIRVEIGGGYDAVVGLLKSMSEGMSLDPQSKLNHVKNQVIEYCSTPFSRYLALLKFDYFSSPSAAITLIYTLLGVYLAAIQTVFTVLSYHPK